MFIDDIDIGGALFEDNIPMWGFYSKDFTSDMFYENQMETIESKLDVENNVTEALEYSEAYFTPGLLDCFEYDKDEIEGILTESLVEASNSSQQIDAVVPNYNCFSEESLSFCNNIDDFHDSSDSNYAANDEDGVNICFLIESLPHGSRMSHKLFQKYFLQHKNAFQCPFTKCCKLYAKPSHLKAHLRRHNGVKPFICKWDGCSWRFSRSDELARHIKSHSGVKPYKCTECIKCFSRSDHLNKHVKVHRRRESTLYSRSRSGRNRRNRSG